jgi:hypothetical protein
MRDNITYLPVGQTPWLKDLYDVSHFASVPGLTLASVRACYTHSSKVTVRRS